MAGSSPHTRGAPPTSPTGSVPSRDHPRIRGEHLVWCWSLSELAGSSPHTRGAHVVSLGGFVEVQDHPRIRGEHMPLTRVRTMSSGSSPHTRGALPQDVPHFGQERIIPAYAGSTCCGLPARLSGRDHPRIRGEHEPRSHRRHTEAGSSPHTRGALDWSGVCFVTARIIPAYAGSTASAAFWA